MTVTPDDDFAAAEYAPGTLDPSERRLQRGGCASLSSTRSSRRLEAECRRNIEVVWLLRTLKPDFKTIADFRRDNCGAFKAVFRQFVLLSRAARSLHKRWRFGLRVAIFFEERHQKPGGASYQDSLIGTCRPNSGFRT